VKWSLVQTTLTVLTQKRERNKADVTIGWQRLPPVDILAGGMVEDRLLAVSHAQRVATAVISARLAEPRERRRYHEENS
jgi:hypothetical protein